MNNVKIIIDGTMSFSNDRETWPTNENGNVLECMYFENIENVTFTSSGKGVINGDGQKWWGAIQFLLHQENLLQYDVHFQ